RKEEFQRRTPGPGLQAGEGARRDARDLRQLGEGGLALPPQCPQPRAHLAECSLKVLAHAPSLQYRRRSVPICSCGVHRAGGGDRTVIEKLEDRYDVVVVGGGAAGLSGALTLARSRRTVLVVDAGEPRNAPATGIHGLLGMEGIPPAEYLERG